MAIKLEDKPNTVAPDADYPYGNIQDNTGGNNGTPVNALVYADFHQFFAKMMAESAIVYNDQPDNATNGFQYFLALQAVINSSLLIKKKIVEIGDWKMDSTANISVAHGIADFTKIRSVDVYIIDDGATNIYPLNMAFKQNPTPDVQGTVGSINSTDVVMYRLTGGTFDMANFDSTSYNRGWIHITYVD
jgi:hypothetical protein